jgi:hypothetical protein
MHGSLPGQRVSDQRAFENRCADLCAEISPTRGGIMAGFLRVTWETMLLRCFGQRVTDQRVIVHLLQEFFV